MRAKLNLKTLLLFPWITCLSLGLLAGMAAWMFFSLFSPHESHQVAYRNLIAATDPKQNENKLQPYTATQQHRQTRKDFFFLQKGQRLQMQVISGDSELVLDHHDDTTEVVEKMRDVVCIMQEELYYLLPDGHEIVFNGDGKIEMRNGKKEILLDLPQEDIAKAVPMQLFRYLEAEQALYYYQTERFEAEQARISKYVSPGHQLIKTVKGLNPLMTGMAASVKFRTDAGLPEFTAVKFKAILNMPAAKKGKIAK